MSGNRKRTMTPGGHRDQCAADGCDRLRHYSNGLCLMHYKRLQRHGSLAKPSRKRAAKPCSVDGCEAPAKAKGMCVRHRQRVKDGRPLMDPKVADVPGEDWRPVVGYEDTYSVSSLGRVRREAAGQHTHPGKLLRPQTNRGYLFVQLSQDGVQRYHKVHRLVARAFIGPSGGLLVNHKDLNKANNAAANLEYVTPLQNTRHAIDHGHLPGRRSIASTRAMLKREATALAAQVEAAKWHGWPIPQATQDALLIIERTPRWTA